ncbi:MAG: hypothetical protein ACYCVG_01420 [Leptospirillum sp.]
MRAGLSWPVASPSFDFAKNNQGTVMLYETNVSKLCTTFRLNTYLRRSGTTDSNSGHLLRLDRFDELMGGIGLSGFFVCQRALSDKHGALSRRLKEKIMQGLVIIQISRESFSG